MSEFGSNSSFSDLSATLRGFHHMGVSNSHLEPEKPNQDKKESLDQPAKPKPTSSANPTSFGAKALAFVGGASVVLFAAKAIAAAIAGAALLSNPVGWAILGLAAITIIAVAITAVTKNTELLRSMSQAMKEGAAGLGVVTAALALSVIGLPLALVTGAVGIGIGLPLYAMGHGIEKLADHIEGDSSHTEGTSN